MAEQEKEREAQEIEEEEEKSKSTKRRKRTTTTTRRMTKKKKDEEEEVEVKEDERDGRGWLSGGSPIRVEYGWGRTPPPSPSRYLLRPSTTLLVLGMRRNQRYLRAGPPSSHPPSRFLLHLHLLPRNPSLLRYPRGSSWRLPKTSARERFSRHERGSLRTTDGEDIHGREDLHDDFRANATLKPFTYATHELTHSRNARRGWDRLRSPSHQAAIIEAV